MRVRLTCKMQDCGLVGERKQANCSFIWVFYTSGFWEGSHEFSSVCTSVHLFVCSFVTLFLQNLPPKDSTKVPPKQGFWTSKKSSHQLCLKIIENENSYGSLAFCKNCISRKTLFLTIFFSQNYS